MNSLKRFLIKQNAFDLIAALLVLCLPLSKALPNLLIIPLGVLFLIRLKRNHYPKEKTYIFFASSIIILSIFSLLKGSLIEDIDYFLKLYMVLLLFLLFTQIKIKKLIERAFLAGTIIAIIGSSIAIIQQLIQTPGFLLSNGAIVNKILWLERPYFGIVLALSTFICLKNLEQNKKSYDSYFLVLLFTCFSIYISARLGILLCVLLIFIYLARQYKDNKNTSIGIGIGIILLGGLALGLSDNLFERMKITDDFEETKAKFIDYEPRFVIWPCAYDNLSDAKTISFGLESKTQVETEMINCYDKTIVNNESKREYYLIEKFNTHNQFLDFALLGGYLPAILLLLTFLVSFLSKSVPFEAKVVLLLFFAFFMVENVLQRQLGCFLFGIFIAIYSIPKNNEKN